MPLLITADDLALHLGEDNIDTFRAEALIRNKSGLIQRYCNLVQLTETTDTITVSAPHGPVLRLPRGPVTEVDSVTVDDVAVTNWTLIGDDLIRDTDTWGGPSLPMVVTYTHGLTEVPAEVASVCTDMCARVWSNPTGATSFSIDGYSASFAAFGQSTSSGLSADERLALRDWHRTSASADIS